MLESLGEAALRTLLLAAIVQLGLGLLRVKRPQLRLTAWTVVLAASLAMPVLQWASPLRLSVLPDRASTTVAEAADPLRQTSVSQASRLPFPEDVTTRATALPWLEAFYLLIAGILLLRLTVGIALSLRLVRKATPLHPDWASDTNIRISPDVVAPVTVAHVILLPLDVVSWPAPMREAVLAHERAHIARWDFAMLLAAQINQAVFWFSPLSWWLHRRLATLAEVASDDRAIEATGDRLGYAKILLGMGRRSGPLLRGLAMARPATLKYRIERILSDRPPTTSVSPIQQMILAAGAVSLAIIAASSRPDSASMPATAPLTEQRQSSADLDVLPLESMGQGIPEPMFVPDITSEIASQTPPQPGPTAPATRPSDLPAIAGAIQLIARPTAGNTLSPSISRTIAQRTRADRGFGARDVTTNTGAIVSASLAPGSNDGRGIVNTLGATSPIGQVVPSHRTGQRPDTEPPLLKRVEEPHCTGSYLPKPGGPRTDGPADLIQAKYFLESDGTPWLKLFLGVRTRAMLTGFEVERTSIRTTVLTTIPRGMNHITGTTHGPYGTVSFECVRSDASL